MYGLKKLSSTELVRILQSSKVIVEREEGKQLKEILKMIEDLIEKSSVNGEELL
ncbi:hypothetical protein LC087_00615 [Bacillus carboniphilus]|uniref:Uncharacterized protein n=1 Tax=Bacillus carboniphilus TaxID=86663 RepID=A0ABY9JTS3_9BACI|nr:hypothetical protein [Bacillus carboniphilus]WLR42784.1 hypothetical protein LC087_00615 [Bacillus carboniphilus]